MPWIVRSTNDPVACIRLTIENRCTILSDFHIKKSQKFIASTFEFLRKFEIFSNLCSKRNCEDSFEFSVASLHRLLALEKYDNTRLVHSFHIVSS